jgi:acyl-CoA synthetase (AMP-forming)/AMP-acid ligase II
MELEKNWLFSEYYWHDAAWRERWALIDGETGDRLSYGGLAHSIANFRGLLDTKAIKGGDRITILSRNSFQESLATVACLSSGVIANTLNPSLAEPALTEFITHAEPSLILTDDLSLVPQALRDHPGILPIASSFLNQATTTRGSDRARADGGLLIYTSGTTGASKGVLLTVENIETNVAAAVAAFGYSIGWVSACLLPLYHTFGLISDVLTMLMTGGTVVVLPTF